MFLCFTPVDNHVQPHWKLGLPTQKAQLKEREKDWQISGNIWKMYYDCKKLAITEFALHVYQLMNYVVLHEAE